MDLQSCVLLGECAPSGNIISQVVLTWYIVSEVLFSEGILTLTEHFQMTSRRRTSCSAILVEDIALPNGRSWKKIYQGLHSVMSSLYN